MLSILPAVDESAVNRVACFTAKKPRSPATGVLPLAAAGTAITVAVMVSEFPRFAATEVVASFLTRSL